MAKDSIGKEFVIEGLSLLQDKCAMKIGTDGVLLGRWAKVRCLPIADNQPNPSARILDIGTGSGLLALLLAVRFPDSKVTAIDIDEGACLQALENVERNGLQGRVEVRHCSLQDFAAKTLGVENPQIVEGRFGMIVCNPPYFRNSLKCPDALRSLARHTDSLSFHDLLSISSRLLSPNGTISLVIPAEAKADVDFESVLAGLFPARVTAVKTSPKKPVKRYLLEYSKQPCPIDVDEITL